MKACGCEKLEGARFTTVLPPAANCHTHAVRSIHSLICPQYNNAISSRLIQFFSSGLYAPLIDCRRRDIISGGERTNELFVHIEQLVAALRLLDWTETESRSETIQEHDVNSRSFRFRHHGAFSKFAMIPKNVYMNTKR